MYETDPLILSKLSSEQWVELLDSVWNAPVPRPIVRLLPLRPKVAFAQKQGVKLTGEALIDRNREVHAFYRSGKTREEVAERFGISLYAVDKILHESET
jgi:hypothetical protein